MQLAHFSFGFWVTDSHSDSIEHSLGVASPLRHVPGRTRAAAHSTSSCPCAAPLPSALLELRAKLGHVFAVPRDGSARCGVSVHEVFFSGGTRIHIDLSGVDELPKQHHKNVKKTSVSAAFCIEACPLPRCEQSLPTNSTPSPFFPIACSLASIDERGAMRAIMVGCVNHPSSPRFVMTRRCSWRMITSC